MHNIKTIIKVVVATILIAGSMVCLLETRNQSPENSGIILVLVGLSCFIVGVNVFGTIKTVKNEKVHNLYKEIVIRENEIMEQLAKTNEVDFIDIYKLMPKVKENFLDTIHLTPAGMEILAEEISKKINLS